MKHICNSHSYFINEGLQDNILVKLKEVAIESTKTDNYLDAGHMVRTFIINNTNDIVNELHKSRITMAEILYPFYNYWKNDINNEKDIIDDYSLDEPEYSMEDEIDID